MNANFEIDDAFIAEQNQKAKSWVQEDYDHLARKLQRRKVDIEDLVAKASAFRVAVPSWGVGTGGTRFARFPAAGEPRDIYEKLEDCATIFKLVRSTPAVSLHIPWDKPDDAGDLREFARQRGLHFDAMNSSSIPKDAFIRSFLQDRLSVIDIFAMPNTNYFDYQRGRCNGKDNAVSAFSYPIGTFRTNQLFDSGRKRILG